MEGTPGVYAAHGAQGLRRFGATVTGTPSPFIQGPLGRPAVAGSTCCVLRRAFRFAKKQASAVANRQRIGSQQTQAHTQFYQHWFLSILGTHVTFPIAFREEP
jgi:hypothetical protein